MATKDELESENAELRRRVADLEQEAAQRTPAAAASRRRPQRPTGADGKPVLSAGEADDLAQHGVCISPFTGETLNALDEGITPGTPEALAAAKRAQQKAKDTTAGDRNAWPVSGPPPPSGGDTDPQQ